MILIAAITFLVGLLLGYWAGAHLGFKVTTREPEKSLGWIPPRRPQSSPEHIGLGKVTPPQPWPFATCIHGNVVDEKNSCPMCEEEIRGLRQRQDSARKD